MVGRAALAVGEWAARIPRPAALVLAAAEMAVIFALSSREIVIETSLPFLVDVAANLVHVGLYGVLAGLLFVGLGRHPAGSMGRGSGRDPRTAAAKAIRSWADAVPAALAALYGATDEWHQSMVPGRTPSALDLATDVLAAGAAVALLRAMRDDGDSVPRAALAWTSLAVATAILGAL
jgi:hypothetical protein